MKTENKTMNEVFNAYFKSNDLLRVEKACSHVEHALSMVNKLSDREFLKLMADVYFKLYKVEGRRSRYHIISNGTEVKVTITYATETLEIKIYDKNYRKIIGLEITL